MVQKKGAASKSKVAYEIERDTSFPAKKPSEASAEKLHVEMEKALVTRESDSRKQVESEEEDVPLPKEREYNQPAITSFFTRTPVKKKDKEAVIAKAPEAKEEERKSDEAKETSSNEKNTSLSARRATVRKGKEAQKQAEKSQEKIEKQESKISSGIIEETPKSKTMRKLPPRKSPRGSAQKEMVLFEEQEQVKSTPIQKKKGNKAQQEKEKEKLRNSNQHQ